MKRSVFAMWLALAVSFGTAPAIARQDSSSFELGLISDGGVFGLTRSPDGAQALLVNSNGRCEKLVIMESHLGNVINSDASDPFKTG